MRWAAWAALVGGCLLLAGCTYQGPGESIDGSHISPPEQAARSLAASLHGKFAYVGIPGTARHVYEVSGPGLSDLVAVRLSQDGRLDSVSVDAGPLLRGGVGTLFTSG